MDALLIFGLLAALMLAAAFLYRVEAVKNYRLDLLARASVANETDIANGFYDWHGRYARIDAVPFDRMVWRFWRPLDSFYPDRSFLLPRQKRDPRPTGIIDLSPMHDVVDAFASFSQELHKRA